MTILGKVFKAGLNLVRPTAKGWAKPGQTGWKAFINGTQWERGHSIFFRGGLKHKVLQVGYPKAMKNYHNVITSPNATGRQISEAYNRMPNCLHQAARELSDLMGHGVKI